MPNHRVAPWMALFFLAFATPAAAQDQNFTITPYLWLPTFESNFRFDAPPGAGSGANIEVGPVDYLDSLDGVFMIQGEARLGRFGVFGDFISIEFEGERGSVRSIDTPGGGQIPIDIGTTAGLDGMMVEVGGGYDLIQNEDLRLQAYIAARYLEMDAAAQVRLEGPIGQFPQEAALSRTAELWDGVVGVRGEGRAGAWVFPYSAEVGAGDSEFTWQASAGVGYRWGWGDLAVSYRHLEYEQGDDGLIENLTLSGPLIGASFRF